MRQAQQNISIATRGRGLFEFTREARAFLAASGLTLGQMTIFCRHTSASLLIQENADPSVRDDLLAFFDRIAPEGPGLYGHENEGPDDMPAHLRAAMTPTSLSVPFVGGQLSLGTWQGLYLFEHRRAAHRRDIVLHAMGE
ncbi:MAG TPA: secondary thiamine-phosphate synthase enzyme YjbQ [Rhodoblastus sp.]|nr:secondary thiamine-phosphate synthase enzyme YjbQ [Rhodoblastus sp.]